MSASFGVSMAPNVPLGYPCRARFRVQATSFRSRTCFHLDFPSEVCGISVNKVQCFRTVEGAFCAAKPCRSFSESARLSTWCNFASSSSPSSAPSSPVFGSYSRSYPGGDFSQPGRELGREAALSRVVFVGTIGDDNRFPPDGGCAGPKGSLAATASRPRGTF